MSSGQQPRQSCHRPPQWGLAHNRNRWLMVPEAGKSQLKVLANCKSSESCVRVPRCHLLAVSTQGGRAPAGLLPKGPDSTQQGSTLQTWSPLKGPVSYYYHPGVRISTYNYGRDKNPQAISCHGTARWEQKRTESQSGEKHVKEAAITKLGGEVGAWLDREASRSSKRQRNGGKGVEGSSKSFGHFRVFNQNDLGAQKEGMGHMGK